MMNFDLVFFGSMPAIFLACFTMTVLICGVFAVFGTKIAKRRNDLAAIQASHIVLVPRLGGVAIFASMLTIVLMVSLTPWYLEDWIVLIVAICPIFIVGLAEDLGVHTPPATRLGAICVSGLITALYWDLWVVDLGFPFLDAMMSNVPLAIVLSIFMAAGVTNGFNLIDGLNGLLGFYTLSTSLTLVAFGMHFGVQNVALAGMLFVSISSGFLLLNFPKARIFMGDAGAYLVGHFLVWVAIGMQGDVVERGGYVSPFAILLIFFWPVADTALAVWRRRKSGRPSFHPDRLHFHQLVRRTLEIRYLGRGKRELSNPLATLVVIPLFTAPQVAAFWLAEHEVGSMICVVTFSFLFFSSYVLLVRLAKNPNARRRPVLA